LYRTVALSVGSISNSFEVLWHRVGAFSSLGVSSKLGDLGRRDSGALPWVWFLPFRGHRVRVWPLIFSSLGQRQQPRGQLLLEWHSVDFRGGRKGPSFTGMCEGSLSLILVNGLLEGKSETIPLDFHGSTVSKYKSISRGEIKSGVCLFSSMKGVYISILLRGGSAYTTSC